MIEWKRIRDGKPPLGVPMIVTVQRDCEGPKRVVLAPVYYMKTPESGYYGFFEHGNLERPIGPHYFEVIAWDYYPKPWEGELDEE